MTNLSTVLLSINHTICTWILSKIFALAKRNERFCDHVLFFSCKMLNLFYRLKLYPIQDEEKW